MSFIIKVVGADPDSEFMCDYDQDADAVMSSIEHAMLFLQEGQTLTITCVKCTEDLA